MFDIETFINNITLGLSIGIGNSLALWIMNRHFFRTIEKLETKLKKEENN